MQSKHLVPVSGPATIPPERQTIQRPVSAEFAASPYVEIVYPRYALVFLI